ncbi:Leukocyte elastase inhibitor C, partial [Lucilia cuprina]
QNKTQILILALLVILVTRALTTDTFFDLDNFSIKLFYELASSKPQYNQVISTFSIASFLVLLRPNAETTTAYEVNEKLGLLSQAAEHVQSKFAVFEKTMDKNLFIYNANNISMQAANTQIEEIILNQKDLLNAVLDINICQKCEKLALQHHAIKLELSASYEFKGNFRHEFSSINSEPFYVSGNTKIDMDMLVLAAKIRFADIPELEAYAFEIPLHDRLNFLVILISKMKGGIRDLENNFQKFSYTTLQSYMKPHRIKIHFPKVNFFVERSLRDELENLGLGSMFKKLCEVSAFIRVSNIFYNASFSYDEKNIGVSLEEDTDGSDLNDYEEHIIDHPFIFMVTKFPFKSIILTLLLTLTQLARANIFNLENFGQKLFLELSSSQEHENQLLAPLPIAEILVLLRQSAEANAAYEIGENLDLISIAADEITTKFLQQIEKFNGDEFIVMNNTISLQTQKNSVDRTSIITDRFALNICHRTAMYRQQNQAIKEFKLEFTTEIQFKGMFRYAFLGTDRKPFHTSDSTTIDKEMLTLQANLRFAEIPELKVKVFEIPYSNGNNSLMILLPDSQQNTRDLEVLLKEFPLSNIESYLKPRWIKLQFPMGEIVIEKSVKEALQNLGIKGIFNRLCDIEYDIHVSDIIFKGSFIIGDNNAGVNPKDDIGSSDASTNEEFIIDHPFIFMVKAAANETYLIGKFSK